MENKFTDHPHVVNETYLEHMVIAFGYASGFALLTIQAIVHAVFPWIFNGAISGKCCEIADHIRGRLQK